MAGETDSQETGESGVEEEKNRQVNASEIESLLERLPGVMSSRIVTNDWGAIEEIHVLSDDSRGAKLTVRDVESMLAARWGINVDHKKISVAQIHDKTPSVREERVQYTGLNVSRDLKGRTASVSVRLELPDGKRLQGTATGPLAGSRLPLLSARACVNAIKEGIDGPIRLELDAFRITAVESNQMALAVVTMILASDDQRLLTGSALVEDDKADAAVRATLDACNRYSGRLLNFD